MNVEAFLIQGLADALGVPVDADVPDPRPARFVTVERTGGPRSDWGLIDRPQVAVQCWAESRYEAAMLADAADVAMHSLAGEGPLRMVTTESISNFPAEGPHARYQIIYTLVAKTGQ